MGQRLAKKLILDTLWPIILGDNKSPGYDVEFVSGINEGTGVDGVGAEAGWVRNTGTSGQDGAPVMVKFHRRVAP